MAIKEKPKDLEFTYEDDDGRIVYDVKFSEETGTVTMTGFTNDDNPTIMIFGAKALAEIVDFLRENKVIEGGSPSYPSTLTYPPGVRGGALPLPQIETKDGSAAIPAPVEGFPSDALVPNAPPPANTMPIASFDISASPSPAPVPVPVKTATGPVIINKGNNDDLSDIPKRNVIRTRVKDVDDPMGAEREAAAQRKKNPKKTIKRAVDDGV
jgi:hypothetical protein